MIGAALSGFLQAAKIPCEWTGVEKIVTVGDLHGDYENFVKILRGVGIVDESLHWVAGKTHLVQMGDIMDRGNSAKEIFDLLMNLEKEAESAGGMVHVLLGNHEEANITGQVFRYPDYLSDEQFRKFLPDSFRNAKDKDLQKKIRTAERLGDRGPYNHIAEKFWGDLKRDPRIRGRYYTNFMRNYGRWLLKKNAVIKINECIFVHGGISEEFSTWPIQEINDRLRSELGDVSRAIEHEREISFSRPVLLYAEEGPLWFREFAQPNSLLPEEVDLILANLGARYMIIAHTPQIAVTRDRMMRFGGKVWIVDTGIARIYGGHLSALIIEGDEFTVWGEGYEQTKENDCPSGDLLDFRPWLWRQAAVSGR